MSITAQRIASSEDPGVDVIAESLPPSAGRAGTVLRSVAEPSNNNHSNSRARNDVRTSVGWYLQSLRQYPLLSREEEQAIALEYVRTGDKALAKRLTTANLRLVVKIALEYPRARNNLLDLVQEGNMGLVRAVEKYDPRRGVKLATYASWWIRAYILKFILSNARLVKIGTTQAQRRLFFGLGRERNRLQKQRGEENTDARHLAAVFDVSEKLVVEMERRLGASEASLDAPVGRAGADGDRTRGESLRATDDAQPDVRSETYEFRAALQREMAAFEKTLKGRDIEIFNDRLIAEDSKTLVEIADRFGVSRERVRQLESRLKKRLREHLRQSLGDAVPAEHCA